MFGWFRKKRDRTSPQGRQAKTSSESDHDTPANFRVARGQIAFQNAERGGWDESFDCVESLRDAMLALGREPATEGDVIVDTATGIRCRPTLVGFEPLHPVGAKTTTTIVVEHPAFGDVQPMEFQHSTGDSTTASLAAGFDQWCRSDLIALADASRPMPGTCLSMDFDFPAEGDRPARRRRVIFGPVVHLGQTELQSETPDGHAFCACCLFTRSLDAFKPLVESGGFKALRLFAMRGADGVAAADCRVNGEDFAPGQAGLAAYVGTWPGDGFEFRKQYVIVQDRPDDT